ncbi:LysR family transcriptional regulator, partial [Rhodoplanes sp. SY1]
MDITLRQIRSFLAIVQTRSFTKAAALLHLSQPA